MRALTLQMYPRQAESGYWHRPEGLLFHPCSIRKGSEIFSKLHKKETERDKNWVQCERGNILVQVGMRNGKGLNLRAESPWIKCYKKLPCPHSTTLSINLCQITLLFVISLRAGLVNLTTSCRKACQKFKLLHLILVVSSFPLWMFPGSPTGPI